MTHCERKGRHKFRPRYVKTLDFPPAITQMALKGIQFKAPEFSLVNVTTYYGDVCEWCGAVVNRPEEEEQN